MESRPGGREHPWVQPWTHTLVCTPQWSPGRKAGSTPDRVSRQRVLTTAAMESRPEGREHRSPRNGA